MKGRAYIDYSPIKIMWPVKGEVSDSMAQKAGLSGNFILVEAKDLPKSKEHRAEWKHSHGKIVEDMAKVAAKIQAEHKKEQKKNSLKLKLKDLGLKDDEISEIGRL